MYCGDNGTPSSAARTAMTLRDQKGSLYEGGVRVPGVVEWPAVITKSSATSEIAVTSDILPTLAAISSQSLPDRPLDGVSLFPLLKDPDSKQTEPVYFWEFEPGNVFGESVEHYIEPDLQEGTTPLAKMMAGKYTRTFRNYVYKEISENDYRGDRSMMHGPYKLVLEGNSPNHLGFELYNIEEDPGERNNLADNHPGRVLEMQGKLRKWQESVLSSLMENDYE